MGLVDTTTIEILHLGLIANSPTDCKCSFWLPFFPFLRECLYWKDNFTHPRKGEVCFFLSCVCVCAFASASWNVRLLIIALWHLIGAMRLYCNNYKRWTNLPPCDRLEVLVVWKRDHNAATDAELKLSLKTLKRIKASYSKVHQAWVTKSGPRVLFLLGG